MREFLDFGSQMVTSHIKERVVKLPFAYDTVELPVAQKSISDSMNTDSDDFTSASSTEGEVSEEYFVGFPDEVLQEAQKEVPSREETRSILLASNVSHLDVSSQESVCQYLLDTEVIAWSTKDLRPAEVPVKHCFELTDGDPIYSRPRRMPPEHN